MQNSKPNQQEGNPSDLTTGSIPHHLLRMTGPIILSHILQDAFNVVDMICVGRLGAVSLAAVTISGNLLRLIGVLSLGISTGTVILISQLIGAKKQEQAEDLATQALILAVAFSGLISVVGYFSAEFGLRILGAEPGVIQQGKTYMQITLVGSITMFTSMTLGAIYRSTGDTMTPMVVLILSTILNIILDLVLIFGLLGFPRLEVAGSAYATVIGRGVGALALLLLCISGRKGLYIRYRRPNFDKMWQIMRLGIFSAMQGFWRHLSRIGFIWFVAKHGTLAVAAYGVCMRLRVFVMNPGFALAGAVAPMVGQNIGAKQIDRARASAKFGTIVAVAMMTVVGLVVFIIPDLSIYLFINDSKVIGIGRVFLRYLAPTFGFIAFSLVLGRALNGTGDTFWPMTLTFFSQGGLLIAFLLIQMIWQQVDLLVIWIGISVSNIVQGVMMWTAYRWRMGKIDHRAKVTVAGVES